MVNAVIKPSPKSNSQQKKKQTTTPEADEHLQADIKAFASRLGLASAGNGQDFNDEEFRPENAHRKIGQRKPSDKSSAEGNANGAVQKPSGKQPLSAASVLKSKTDAKVVKGTQRHGGKQWNQKKPNALQHKYSAPEDVADVPKVPASSLLPKNVPAAWFDIYGVLGDLPPEADTAAANLQPMAVDQLRLEGERLLEREAQHFEWQLSQGPRGDLKWLQQARKTGTLQDKIAALTVLVQESAVSNISALDSLVSMVVRPAGGKRLIGMAAEALQELFVATLLPDRKLKFFEQQPLKLLPANGKLRQQYLLMWAAEDAIKRRYALFLNGVEAASRDNIVWLKEKALKVLYDSLAAKPEAEARLLAALVNKLGDPDRQIASKACYLLTLLLNEHPVMKLVVVREVEYFMFRPGLGERARYYCIVFLNQLVLSAKEVEGGAALAKKLIHVYFTLFNLLLTGRIGFAAQIHNKQDSKQPRKGSKGAKHSKGAKGRAGKGPKGKTHSDTKRGSPAGGPADEDTATKDAGAAPQVMAMDSRMLSAILTGVRRAFPFVPAEEVEPLVQAHADSLFRLAHHQNLAVALQSLLLLHTLMAAQIGISDRFYRALYTLLLDPELTRSSKTSSMFLSLLFKAVKADHSVPRAVAFLKRLLQVALHAPAHFAAGCLFIASEMTKAHPALSHGVSHAEDHDDDLEHFRDVDEPPRDGVPLPTDAAKTESATLIGDGDAADAQVANKGREPYDDGQQTNVPRVVYDMKKREPLFANAAGACLWELPAYLPHFHPSVAAWARTLLQGVAVEYKGDPLKDMTLMAFLDKFMQKKPKSKAELKGASAMQPLKVSPEETQPLATNAFTILASDDIAPDSLFFHKYFSLSAVQRRQAAKQASKLKSLSTDDEEVDEMAASDDDDAIDDFLAGEEDHGDEGLGADPNAKYDYNMLRQALEADAEAASDGETDVETDEGADDGTHVEADERADKLDDETEDTASMDSVPDDVNPFELGSASNSEADDQSHEGSSSDEGEWVMADGEGAPSTAPSSSGAKRKRETGTAPAKEKKAKKRQERQAAVTLQNRAAAVTSAAAADDYDDDDDVHHAAIAAGNASNIAVVSDEDIDAIHTDDCVGSDDDLLAMLEDDEEEDSEGSGGKRGAQKRKGRKTGALNGHLGDLDGGDVFASVEDYQDMIAGDLGDSGDAGDSEDLEGQQLQKPVAVHIDAMRQQRRKDKGKGGHRSMATALTKQRIGKAKAKTVGKLGRNAAKHNGKRK